MHIEIPSTVRCSRPGCTQTHQLDGALALGWVMIVGQWVCPEDRDRAEIDGIDQLEPEVAEEAVLEVDPEQTLDMAGEDP